MDRLVNQAPKGIVESGDGYQGQAPPGIARQKPYRQNEKQIEVEQQIADAETKIQPNGNGSGKILLFLLGRYPIHTENFLSPLSHAIEQRSQTP